MGQTQTTYLPMHYYPLRALPYNANVKSSKDTTTLSTLAEPLGGIHSKSAVMVDPRFSSFFVSPVPPKTPDEKVDPACKFT